MFKQPTINCQQPNWYTTYLLNQYSPWGNLSLFLSLDASKAAGLSTTWLLLKLTKIVFQLTAFLSKTALHLLGVIIAPKSGDHASFNTYYSSKEFNREVQSIFLITTLHPIAPDFWNHQCSFYVDFWTEGLVFHKLKESITTFWYYKVDPPEQQCD